MWFCLASRAVAPLRSVPDPTIRSQGGGSDGVRRRSALRVAYLEGIALFVTRQPWHPGDGLDSHNPHMRLALALARRSLGRSSPNPAVGAVVVRDGTVVGRGSTAPVGGPHAEVLALAQAGAAARGADLYVTLEPCCHHGRTPPCTTAVIAAGIRKVHVATLDPNPQVAGGGAAALRAADVAVEIGLGGAPARRLIAPFRQWVLRGRPQVLAKYAMTLDGRIASRSGDSRWVSGPEARLLAHRLRDVSDAIMVGSGTVLADDPALTTRLPDETAPHHPLRVILDSRGRLPLTSRVFDPALEGQTLVATVAAPDPWRRTLEDRGLSVWSLPPDAQGRVALGQLLARLAAERGVASLLLEGGAAVLGAAFGAGLIDNVLAFIAPKVIGGRDAPGPVGDPGRPRMAQALSIDRLRWLRVGQDLAVWGALP